MRSELRLARARDKVHGAYLFEGGPGTGARELGIWFARLLLCRAGEDDPCGTCRDCRLALSSAEEGSDRPTHPDCKWVEPDGAFVKVDQIRELQRELSLVANEGGRRVGLIMGADMLRTEAANALLKTLEEPPGDTTLILVADAVQALAATLRSRTTHVRVARMPERELCDALVGEGLDREGAYLASTLGGGSLTSAQSWAEEHLDDAREMRDAILGGAAPGRGRGRGPAPGRGERRDRRRLRSRALARPLRVGDALPPGDATPQPEPAARRRRPAARAPRRRVLSPPQALP